MQRLEVSGAVRPIYGSLGLKRLSSNAVCVASIWKVWWSVEIENVYKQANRVVPHSRVTCRWWWRGSFSKDGQEWVWKDETVANFEPLKEYGNYVSFTVSFQTPSISLMPKYVHFVEFSQPIRSISLKDAQWRRLLWSTNWRCVHNFWWMWI